jgi:hypothetical protein
MTRSAYLGAAGWNQPSWVGPLYPEDMPEDWRLAYYGTQYSCLWLAQEVWMQLDADTLSTWLGEVADGFRFLLQGRQEDIERHFPGVAATGKDGPWLIAMADEGIIRFDAQTDLAELTMRIRTSSGEPIYLISIDGHLEKMSEVATLLELLAL